MIKGLYLHIPFCEGICSYCDFYRVVSPRTRISAYVSALARDITAHAGEFPALETIFLGGGTPSVLHPEDFRLLKRALTEAGVPWERLTEVALEADPADVNEEAIKAWQDFGVTRVSLGIQSLDDAKLKLMRRRHDAKTALSALDSLQDRFSVVNADLIHGFPGDTPERIIHEALTILDHGAESLSLYGLIIEEKSVIGRLVRAGEFIPLTDEESRAIDDRVSQALAMRHCLRYEIANFALPGCASRHNSLYWDYQDFLGLGPGAASKIGDRRFTVARDLTRYLEGTSVRSEDLVLSRHDQETEMLMMGLRRPEGILLSDYLARYGTKPEDDFPLLMTHLSDGTLARENGRLFIPGRFLYVEDAILCDLFA